MFALLMEILQSGEKEATFSELLEENHRFVFDHASQKREPLKQLVVIEQD